ncbi:MAG TPA: hypothetical protein VHU91_08295 [Mycobacteriales bacterium]|nr:hypothetical protein [Mycobacteriales bacterium]
MAMSAGMPMSGDTVWCAITGAAYVFGGVTMGRIERPGSNGLTRYIWYPGNVDDWKKVAIAVGTGGVVFLGLELVTHDLLWATLVGATVTACMTGFALGNKDASGFGSIDSVRSSEAGRALWRAMAKGFGAAGAAILLVHVTPAAGVLGWILPLVPGISGGLAHQCGVMHVRLSAARAAEAAELKKGSPVAAG